MAEQPKVIFIAGSGTSLGSINFTPGSPITLPSATKNNLVPSQYEFIGWTTDIVEESSTLPTPLYEAGSEYIPQGNTDIKLYAVYKAQQDEWVDATNEDRLIDGDYAIFWERSRQGKTYYGWTPVIENLTDENDDPYSQTPPGWAWGSYGYKIRLKFKQHAGFTDDADFLNYPEGLASLYHFTKIGNKPNQEYLISVQGIDDETYYFRNYHSDYWGVGFINGEQKPRGWTLTTQTLGKKTSRYLTSAEYPGQVLVANDTYMAFIVGSPRGLEGFVTINPTLHLLRKPFVKYATYPEDINNPNNLYVTIKNYQWAALTDPENLSKYQEIESDEYPDVYHINDSVTVSKTINTNYDFISLIVNGIDKKDDVVISDNVYSYTLTDITENTTFSWYIKRKKGTFNVKNADSEQGTLQISIANNGTAVLDGDKYECNALWGSAVSLKGIPINENWTFLGFTVGEENPENPTYIKKITFTGEEILTYYPHFVNKCTIKCSIQSYQGINVGTVSINNSTNSVLLDPGETYILNAKANNGFIFGVWSIEEGTEPPGFDKYNPKQTIVASGSVTLKAHFHRFSLPIRQTNQHKVNYYDKTEFKEEKTYVITLIYKGQKIQLNWNVKKIPLISRSFTSTRWWDKNGVSCTMYD